MKKDKKNPFAESGFPFIEMFDSIMEGFCYVDMEGNIQQFNEVYRKMLGYSTEELQELTYRDLTPQKWHDFEQKVIEEQVLKNGSSEVYEKEYIRKDGSVFPIELRTMLIRDDSGENQGMWAFIRDITNRKKRDRQIRENEYWLKESQRIGRLGSYTFDIKNNSFTCSEVLDHIFGMSKDSEKTLETWSNLVVPEQRAEMLDYFMNYVFLERQPFDKEYEIIRANDNERCWVWGHGELIFDEDGVPVTMFGIIQDINDRKKAEEILRRSEIEYRDTLNAVPDMVFVVDETLRVLTVNRAFREEYIRLGFSDSFPGKKITAIIPLISSNLIETIQYTFRKGSGVVISEKIDLHEKSIYAEFRIIPFIKSKKVNKVIVLIRDRSKEAEIEELKVKNLEQKEVLLREIHHRVKNNLSIVISLLNFQLRKHTDPTLNRIIQDIQMRIRSMALIHEHLYFSETLDRIPLAAYIIALTLFIKSSFNKPLVHLESRLDPMDVKIEKALPLGLIINELLTNAYKYAFPGDRKGEIMVYMKKEGTEMVSLHIKDNGIGLPQAVSMESEKSLGLFIVNLLVEQLEGKIEIIRENGTEFILRFANIIQDDQLSGKSNTQY